MYKKDTLENLINDPTFNTDEWFGFIYLIENTINGKKYIGKKNFRNVLNKRLGKKEIKALPTTRGRNPSKKQIISESDWKTYYSSCDEIKNDPDKSKFNRYILKLCKTKTSLSYYEVKYQMIYDVLESENWYNNTILGKFYRNNIINE